MKENMTSELVSVVIPVYNVEHYLPKCIESVIKQTYAQLEIILVDDGATDLSGKICEQYAKRDSRIQVIHKPNGGLSDARNCGLERATGKYITFIDSDDYVSKYFVERLYTNIVKTGADISIGNFLRVKENTEIQDNIEKSCEFKVYDRIQSFTALYDKELKDIFTTAWGKIYKRELFELIRYPVGRNYEDTSIAHLVYNLITKVVYENVKIYYYLERENSITKSEQFIKDDAILAVRDRMEFLEKNGYHEILGKAREDYFATLMGVYARTYSDKIDVSQRKKQIYAMVRQNYDKYKNELQSRNMKIRIWLFILAPDFYTKILRMIKN